MANTAKASAAATPKVFVRRETTGGATAVEIIVPSAAKSRKVITMVWTEGAKTRATIAASTRTTPSIFATATASIVKDSGAAMPKVFANITTRADGNDE